MWNYFIYNFRKKIDSKINNEVNSDQVESSSKDVEHNSNIDKPVKSDTSMLLIFLLNLLYK